MPWFWIRNLSDDDLRAIYAYLNSIPPVRKAVPKPKIAEEVVWQLRDGFDRFAAQLPQEEWAAAKRSQPEQPAAPAAAAPASGTEGDM